MPLHYEVTKPLTVPDHEFNENHIAVLLVIGNRYGGQWEINLLSQREHPTEAAALGTIETFYDHQREDLTDSPRYTQLGLDTALIWLLAEAKERNWRLLVWESVNDQVPEDARKFTIGARVALGGEQFVPAPGATYADEILTGAAKP
ncbi:MAG TPA: hypothetical protein VN520_04045 [Streptomyces sp.]|uniref:hypothetical protein n=1 Tax=Streptomyces sp. TaxID=1931 RepID=UPI002BD645C3|nr:hypothetical protein [Streptomyces sp.]HWU05566.1 hypothetical protein [Streptomyces sp.]